MDKTKIETRLADISLLENEKRRWFLKDMRCFLIKKH